MNIKKHVDDFISDYSKKYDLRLGKPFNKEKANCSWFTNVFCDWAKENKLPVKVVYFDSDEESHTAPIINGKIIDFTIKQFTKNPNDDYKITSPEDYKKYGYDKSEILDKVPTWFTIREADKKIQERKTMKYLKLFESFSGRISENLQYHIDNNKPIVENVFRPGSNQYFNLIKEARQLFDANQIELSELDTELFESTDIGLFAEYEGVIVPLDLPMETIEELNEAEYQGREVKLNYPMRGGTKKYHVYVKNPKTGNVKKIAFGDVHGGLTAKVSDPKARKSFAARHKCDSKKDKTKAGYWACRINKFGHLFGGKTYPGYW